MDAFDIFRKLTTGVYFDTKKFYNDAQKFQLVKTKPVVGPVLPTLKTEESSDKSTPSAEGQKRKKKKSKEKLLQKHKEKMAHYRRVNHISVDGTDVPDPVESFTQLGTKYGISDLLLKNIGDAGYDAPTPIQMQAIPVMLQSREILACAPTGSGKTAAFLLPILQQLKGPEKKGFRAVIVAPTRELAKQILRECERLSEGTGLRAHFIHKAGTLANNTGMLLANKFDILVTTPNRLVYLLQQDPPGISLRNVEWLIVDESDKLFEAGRTGFRDQLAAVYQACDSASVRRAMFSATFAHEVEQWCRLNLDNVIMVNVGARNAAADLVQQELLFVGSEMGKLIAFRDLVRKGLEPPVLVFVQSKERARELFNELIYDGINVDVIHAERTQLQRDNTVKSFRCGNIWVLICTELMGRGMDFKGVNLVVNYDFPPTAISYIHRIGRTGRAGRPGKAITFFTEDDVICLRSIAQVMRDSGCEVPEYMLRLKKLPRQIRRQMDKHPIYRGHVTSRSVRNMVKKKLRKKGKTQATDNLGDSEAGAQTDAKDDQIKNNLKRNGPVLSKKKDSSGKRKAEKSAPVKKKRRKIESDTRQEKVKKVASSLSS